MSHDFHELGLLFDGESGSDSLVNHRVRGLKACETIVSMMSAIDRGHLAHTGEGLLDVDISIDVVDWGFNAKLLLDTGIPVIGVLVVAVFIVSGSKNVGIEATRFTSSFCQPLGLFSSEASTL